MRLSGVRVMLVGPLPPPAGGMANQTRQLGELLVAEGAEVATVQVNAPYRPAWAGRVRGLRALFRLLPYLAALWRQAGRADLVHVMANSGWSWHLFAAPAIWIAWLRGVPALVNYRGGEAGAFLERSAPLVRWSVRRSAGLLFPSGFLQQVFAQHGMTGRIVPNIVDLARFRPAEAGDDRCRLMVARNLEPIYGIDTAIRAFARVLPRHPGATLAIAGSGPQEGELRALAEREGVAAAVRFTGRLDRDQMAALYRESDLMLNPSRVDNMPNSVLEALACGLPVVSTAVGGVPFIVENERTAMLVPPDDPAAMAEATLRIMSDGSLRDRLVRAGLDDVRRYAWPQVREILIEAYRAAIARDVPRMES